MRVHNKKHLTLSKKKPQVHIENAHSIPFTKVAEIAAMTFTIQCGHWIPVGKRRRSEPMHFSAFQLSQYVEARYKEVSLHMFTVEILVDNEIETFNVQMQMARPLVWSVLAATNGWPVQGKIATYQSCTTGATEKRTVQTMAYCSKVTGKLCRRNCLTDSSKPFIKVTMMLTKYNWELENQFSD